MATDRQMEANRRNALASTGPRSDEGKSQSRANALKHGLAGVGVVVEEARIEAFEARKAAWFNEIRPQTDRGAWSLDKALGATIRLDDCGRAYDAIVVEQTTRARFAWEADRRVEAAMLAGKLTKNPMLVARQLGTTKQGAEVMIAMWDRLGAAMNESGEWSDFETSTALDLLGVPPRLRKGRTPLDVPEGSDPKLVRSTIAASEMARLGRLIADALDAMDSLNRHQAEAAAMVILTKPAALILRYEREAWRVYRDALRVTQARPEAVEETTPIAGDEAHHDEDDAPIEEPDPALDLNARARAAQAKADRARTPEEIKAAADEIETIIGLMGGVEEEQADASYVDDPTPTTPTSLCIVDGRSVRRPNRHARRAARVESRRN